MSSESNRVENGASVNSMSLVVSNEDSNSRRHPENLQGVLRYSIEAAGDNVTSEPNMQPMDDERRAFLEATLRSMTVNFAEQMASYIKILRQSDPKSTEPEVLEGALDQISDLVDNIDNAMDFHKIGGFSILEPGLASSHPSVRSRTAYLIGELSQNNPYIQTKILETEILSILVRILLEDQADCQSDESIHPPDVKTSCLFAISCIVRGNDAALQRFSERNGWAVINHVLDSHNGCSHYKLCIKAAFLVTSVCNYKPEVIDELIGHHFVVQFCKWISATQPQLLEHLLQALLAMVTNSNRVVDLCGQKDMNLLSTLTKILDNHDKETDVALYAQQLKDIVFGP